MVLYIVAKRCKDLIYKKVDSINVEDLIYGVALSREGLDVLIESCVRDYWGSKKGLVFENDIKQLKENTWREYYWFEVNTVETVKWEFTIEVEYE